MSTLKEAQLFFRRNLPHLHPSESTFFITYRLHGTIPLSELKKIRPLPGANAEEGEFLKDGFFESYDALLHKNLANIKYLLIDEIADLNKKALHYYDTKEYDLICYCLMSNHVHVVLKLRDGTKILSSIMHSIKRHTARESNKILNKHGKFWQEESYDRYIRNERELKNTVEYVLNNPVKAGLVDNWEDWPHTFVNFDNM